MCLQVIGSFDLIKENILDQIENIRELRAENKLEVTNVNGGIVPRLSESFSS
jgi:hypothetical protein